jgi:hypothetical protein
VTDAIEALEARAASATPSRWHHPSEMLVGVLMQEEMFDAAWAAVRKHGASSGQKLALAKTCESTHPREAIEVYAEQVDELAQTGGDTAYAGAAALVKRMAGLSNAAEHASYVAGLKERHGRKRNFMKLLA